MAAQRVLNLKDVWDGAKRNLRILDGCDGPHEFESVEGATGTNKFRCVKCGGEMSISEKEWYQKGLAHGRANNISS